MKTHGSNLFTIVYRKAVLKKDIPALTTTAKKLIKKSIEERLTVDPIGFGKPLQYNLKGYRRLRVSSYRIVYSVDLPSQIVTIIGIRHRKNIYETF